MRNTTIRNEWSNYSTHIPRGVPTTPGLIYRPVGTADPIGRAVLTYENVDRVNMSSDYYTLVAPFYSAVRIPQEIGYHLLSCTEGFLPHGGGIHSASTATSWTLCNPMGPQILPVWQVSISISRRVMLRRPRRHRFPIRIIWSLGMLRITPRRPVSTLSLRQVVSQFCGFLPDSRGCLLWQRPCGCIGWLPCSLNTSLTKTLKPHTYIHILWRHSVFFLSTG